MHKFDRYDCIAVVIALLIATVNYIYFENSNIVMVFWVAMVIIKLAYDFPNKKEVQ